MGGASPDEMGYEQKYADEAAAELLSLSWRAIKFVTGLAVIACVAHKLYG